MKHNRAIGFLVLFLIAGCAAIPKQLVDAMEVQKQEIDKVKDVYFANLKNQIDAIEKYQLAILDIYENQCISKYSNALDMVTKDGNTGLAKTDPTGDKNIDFINLGKLEDIELFFNSERQKTRNETESRKEQVNKAAQNFDNIEQINKAISDYMKSLTRLKNSQDKLAIAIKSKIETIIPIPISFDNIPDPSTIEDLVKTLKIK